MVTYIAKTMTNVPELRELTQTNSNGSELTTRIILRIQMCPMDHLRQKELNNVEKAH